ncbi:RNA editing comple protein MP63 [Novymonas esmeraldas]|uniref:RNA editing comple protein MP63 n=1 Tax=Novymonas esmeraldas TaxID=1808958 RepID=A0AAW0FF00_9TRYP
MQRRIGTVAVAAVCRGALRRVRCVEVGVAHASHAGTSLVCAPDAALRETVRFQSAAPERRFHCSVCKKSFRLEMAAKLHIQQVHSGDATVESGSGPGQSEEQAPQTPAGVFRNAPPQAPTVVSPIASEMHERSTRREKPAPKPLHQADREVPGPVMEKLLAVWDDQGVKRMGGEFVHSSMVMRVFAARPSDSSESPYGPMNPEGANPFAGVQTPLDAPAAAAATETARNIYGFNLSDDAYAMASDESFGPLRPARCVNPFLRKSTRDASKSAPKVDLAEEQTAPVTPFGQLPIFGQAPPAAPAAVSAPPAATTTPVAEPVAETGSVVSSPFAAGAKDSPFAGVAESPFAGQGYSPFAAAAEAKSAPAEVAAAAVAAAATPAGAPASPLAATAGSAPSPFASAPSPFAASPFATAFSSSSDPDAAAAAAAQGVSGVSFGSFEAPLASAQAEAAPAPAHVCTECEKSFSTYDGLRMHSKAKHNKELPKSDAPLPKKRCVPDLPAFIPSPVDLTMTSPFGSSEGRSAWTDVQLTPHAQSVSNITVAGCVVDVEATTEGAALLSVLVAGATELESEVVSLHCSRDALASMDRPILRGEFIFACGSLRILPFTDEKLNVMYSSAVVYVNLPTGVVARLS